MYKSKPDSFIYIHWVLGALNFCVHKRAWVSNNKNAAQRSAIEAITSLSAYTASITKDWLTVNTDPDRGPLIRLPAIKENITTAEAKAVTQLKNNEQITIKPADKGGAACVLNPVLYEQEGLRELENIHYYTDIDSLLVNDTEPRICAIIQELYDICFLLNKQHAFSECTGPCLLVLSVTQST